MSLSTGIIIAVILVAINVVGIRREWRKARRRLNRPAPKKGEK